MAVFSGANGPLPSFIKLQKDQHFHNVLTCLMKDCEVRFAKKTVVSDGVWGVGTFAGSFVRWGRSASVGRGLNDPQRTNDPIE